MNKELIALNSDGVFYGTINARTKVYEQFLKGSNLSIFIVS